MHERTPNRRTALIAAATLSLVLLTAACGSDASTEDAVASVTPAATSGATAAGTLTNADGWPRVQGLRGQRYCEVLLASVVDARLNAQVWNTYGLNDCPPDAWAALDAEEIKAERGVVAALLNGPRYWLMDAIEKKPTGERQQTTFGALEMFLAATVDLGPIPPNLAAYTDRHVARGAVFEFSVGSEVYELVDPTGRVFVMQSYSQQRDPAMTEAALASLGDRLTPPAGWTYRVRVLDSMLRVEGPSIEATVVQDELANTYSLVERN